jgi:hypothetical protein
MYFDINTTKNKLNQLQLQVSAFFQTFENNPPKLLHRIDEDEDVDDDDSVDSKQYSEMMAKVSQISNETKTGVEITHQPLTIDVIEQYSSETDVDTEDVDDLPLPVELDEESEDDLPHADIENIDNVCYEENDDDFDTDDDVSFTMKSSPADDTLMKHRSLQTQKVSDLKNMLTAIGKSTSGKKDDLIARLMG